MVTVALQAIPLLAGAPAAGEDRLAPPTGASATAGAGSGPTATVAEGPGGVPIRTGGWAVPPAGGGPGPPATVAEGPGGVPILTGSWTVPPSGGCARLPFQVTLTVSNSGTAAAVQLRARLRIEGSAGATVVEEPGLPDGLPPGGSAALTWRLAALAGGTVTVRTRVRAHDLTGTVTADSGRLVAPELTLVEPGRLEATVAVRPEASVGQWVAVALTVSNTGAVRVDHVRADLAPPAAGRFRTVPPPLPHIAIEPGASLRLLWTWSVAGAGAHAFAASVFADTCDDALPVEATASAMLAAVTPAQLAGTITVSASRIVSSQKLDVVFTLSNTGGAAATGLTVPLPTPATSRAKLVSGPVRVKLDQLPGGSSTRLVWTWVMEGAGPSWFTGRATARDANADWAVGTGLVDSPRIRLLAPAKVKADQFTLFPEPVVRVGGYVTASLVLTNSGESDAQLTSLDIRESTQPGGLLTQRSVVSPSMPMEVPAGDSRSVVWTYRTASVGTAMLDATAKLKEPATGRTLPDVKSSSNRIATTGFIAP